MSFSIVKVTNGLQRGQVVKYDTAQSLWVRCDDNTGQLIGVISEDPFEQNSEHFALIYWGGLVSAICVEQIPVQGGFIGIRDGGVYVDSVNRYGIIQPLAYDQVVPTVGDQVSIHLR